MLIAPPGALDHTAGELLAAYPFIRYTRQAWVGRLIHTMMRRRRIKVVEVMTLDTLEAVTAMVSHGLGVSIVPERRGVPLAFPVRTLALPEPAVHRTVGLLRAAKHPKAPLADALLVELAALAKAPGRKRR